MHTPTCKRVCVSVCATDYQLCVLENEFVHFAKQSNKVHPQLIFCCTVTEYCPYCIFFFSFRSTTLIYKYRECRRQLITRFAGMIQRQTDIALHAIMVSPTWKHVSTCATQPYSIFSFHLIFSNLEGNRKRRGTCILISLQSNQQRQQQSSSQCE